MGYERNRSEFLEALSGAAVARKDREQREVRRRLAIMAVSSVTGALVGAFLTVQGVGKYHEALDYYDQRVASLARSLLREDSQPVVQDGGVCRPNRVTLPKPSGEGISLPVRGQML